MIILIIRWNMELNNEYQTLVQTIKSKNINILVKHPKVKILIHLLKQPKVKISISFSLIQTLVVILIPIIAILTIGYYRSSDLNIFPILLDTSLGWLHIVFTSIILVTIVNTAKVYLNNSSEQWNDYMNGISKQKESQSSNIISSLFLSFLDSILITLMTIIVFNAIKSNLSLDETIYPDPADYKNILKNKELFYLMQKSLPLLFVSIMFIVPFIVAIVLPIFIIFSKGIFMSSLFLIIVFLIICFLSLAQVPGATGFTPLSWTEYLFVLMANNIENLNEFIGYPIYDRVTGLDIILPSDSLMAGMIAFISIFPICIFGLIWLISNKTNWIERWL